MNQLVSANKATEQINQLEELFAKTQEYGTVDLFQHSDLTYSCKITFNSIAGTALTAHSGFNHQEIVPALEAALTKAELIRKEFR